MAPIAFGFASLLLKWIIEGHFFEMAPHELLSTVRFFIIFSSLRIKHLMDSQMQWIKQKIIDTLVQRQAMPTLFWVLDFFRLFILLTFLPWHIWVWFLHCCCTLRWALDCRWQPLSEAVYLNPVASSLMDFVYPVPGIYKIHQWACYWIEILGIAQCAIAQISAVKAIQWLLWSVSSSIHVKG